LVGIHYRHWSAHDSRRDLSGNAPILEVVRLSFSVV
jgi:hypothetical protein